MAETIAAGTEGMVVEFGAGSLLEAAAVQVAVPGLIPGPGVVLVAYTAFLAAKLDYAGGRTELIGLRHNVGGQERLEQAAVAERAAALGAGSGQEFWWEKRLVVESGGEEQALSVDWGYLICHHAAWAQKPMMVQLRCFGIGEEKQILWVLTGVWSAPSELQQVLACL